MPGDSFMLLHFAGEEEHASTEYFWENSARPMTAERLVIQRTLKGAGFYRDSDGRRLVLEDQIMLFKVRENSSYGYAEENAGRPYRLRYLSMHATPSFRPLFMQLREDFGSVLSMPQGLESDALFNEIFTRYRQHTFRDHLHETELIYRLLLVLYREQVMETHTSDPIEYGYNYICSHFRSPVNLKGIAQKCGVSREHFIRQFSRRFGEPPGRMLRRLRIEHAEAMLDATNRTVEEIALASGLLSANTLNRAFRLKYGRTPRGRPTR